MAGGSGRSVEKAAQRMTINGQKVRHKAVSEEDETTSILDKKSVDNPKRGIAVFAKLDAKTKDMLAL
jgi:hypothetical protein